MITIEHLNKQFIQGDKTITALKDVNLNVARGSICGVIGTSGAGKSTLIRCVNLLERPSSGRVILDGQELTLLSSTQLTQARRQIGMIFQHFNLLSSRTIAQNVSFPLELAGTPKSEIKQRVAELLDLVGLSDKAESYPSQLSGGQKQRVAIARALASKPKVLLCDEATSALDPATTRSILELLRNINQKLNLTILLITHEMQVVKQLCNQVAIIEQGSLIEQGSVSDIFANPKSALAKQFIDSTLELNIPDDYLKRLHPTDDINRYPLARLTFSGNSVDAPVITQAAQNCNIHISVLVSNIDYAGGVKFGHMLIELFGRGTDVDNAISFFKQNQIQVEILGYVA